jgi:hypothetical protein
VVGKAGRLGTQQRVRGVEGINLVRHGNLLARQEATSGVQASAVDWAGTHDKVAPGVLGGRHDIVSAAGLLQY